MQWPDRGITALGPARNRLTDRFPQGHRVCRLEGEGTDAGRQGYVTGYVGWKVRGPMKDDRLTGYVCWKARDLMQDDRGTSGV